MRLGRTIVCVVLCTITSLTASTDSEQSIAGVTSEAWKRLGWKTEPNLEFSTETTSRSESYFFVVEYFEKSAQGGEVKRFDIAVSRRDRQVAALVRDGEGNPHCFLSNGLALIFAVGKDGSTAVFQRGAPRVRVVLERKDRRVHLDVAMSKRTEAIVSFSPLELMREAPGNVVHYDPVLQTIEAVGDRGVRRLFLASAADNADPFRRWESFDGSGRRLEVNVALAGKSVPLNLHALTLEKLEKLGIKTFEAGEDVFQTHPLLPQDRAARDHEMQQRLRQLIAMLAEG